MSSLRGINRRGFVGGLATALGGSALIAEQLSAQSLSGRVLAEVSNSFNLSPAPVWLNANEYPEGPPDTSITSMRTALSESNRYHYDEFDSYYGMLADSLQLKSDNLLLGAGSSEVLHCAVEAFVSGDRPYITSWPSFEMGPELAAAKGYPVIKVPLTRDYSADVQALAAAASRAGGGLIYICNPNNPTSSLTSPKDIRWLLENLPSATNLLIDEAYIHFAELAEPDTALKLVREGSNIIVLRTFSKIYGMAGLRVGFAAAPPALIKRMTPYRNNVISIISVRAVQAALSLGPKLIEERRSRIVQTRNGFISWCRKNQFKYIEPHANFVMIETGRQVREVISKLIAKGVVPGRPFPPYDTMLRVTIGKEADMLRFADTFAEVLSN